MTWIIQTKRARGDWETLSVVHDATKKAALAKYDYLNSPWSAQVKVRAVSADQAKRDYEAGRADNYKRKLEAV